jgi:hypothetical protein
MGLCRDIPGKQLSSGDCIGDWKGHGLRVCLAGLKAVVEATQKAVEQVALSGSMSITGESATVVMSSSTDG